MDCTATPYTTSRYIIGGTIQSANGITAVLPNGESSSDDYFNDYIIVIYEGQGKGQYRLITDYVGSTRTITVTKWDVAPNSSSKYYMFIPIVSANPTTAILAAESSGTNDAYNSNYDVMIVMGSGAGQIKTITDYNGTTKIATIGSWTDIPNTDVFQVVARKEYLETAVTSGNFNGEIWTPSAENNTYRIHYSSGRAIFQRASSGKIKTLHTMTDSNYSLVAILDLGLFYEVGNLGNTTDIFMRVRDVSSSIFGNLKQALTKYIFKTTTNLLVTTINEGGTYSAGDTTLTVTSSTGFSVNRYIRIDSEFLYITNISGNNLTVERGKFDTTDDDHTDGSIVSECFSSQLISFEQFTQCQIEISSNTDLNFYGFWFDNSDADNIVRDFTLPYLTSVQSLISNTFPTLTGYARFIICPASSSTTRLLFASKLTNKAISGQTIPVEGFVGSTMVCNLQRSVTVGKQPDGDYVNTPADGSAFTTTSILTSTAINDGSGINDSVTTITVDSTSGFSSSGYIAIETEIIQYTGTTATTFTGCTRGSLSTDASSHNDNDIVKEVYSSAWVDTDGWNTIEVFIATNQQSSERGVIIEHTDDVQSSPPISRGIYRYSFSQNDVIQGSRLFKFHSMLDGFRVHYIDGDTSHTDFFLDSTLKTSVSVEQDVEKLAVSISNDYKGRKASKKYMLGNRSSFPSSTLLVDICEFNPQLAGGNYRIYTPKTNTFGLEISSTDANDSSAGTGVRTVEIIYLNTNWVEKSVVVSLNGTTAVTAVASGVRRVNDMYSVTCGTNGVAAGDLTLTTLSGDSIESPWSGTQTFRYIGSGGNKDRTCLYTVPLNKSVYIDTMTNSSANQDQDIRLRANVNPNTRLFVESNVYLFQTTIFIGSNGNNTTNLNWARFPGKVDIKVSSISANTSGKMSSFVSFIEIEDL